MAKTYQDVDSAFDAIDTLTNELAVGVDAAIANDTVQVTEIAALKAQVLEGSGVTVEQLDALAAKGEARKAALEVVSAALKASGIDGSIPEVPEIPPVDDTPIDPVDPDAPIDPNS